MIITKTPYRISFFGGGTDYHTWYQEHGGMVLSTTINHYNYITCRWLPQFHQGMKNRIVWDELETPATFKNIRHNAIRTALEYYKIHNGVEIINQCDLPSRAGLGSSSCFCAGLIKGLKALIGEHIDKQNLATETINLERNVLLENVGVQDQIATVFGGLNVIKINCNGEFSVNPLRIDYSRKQQFNDNLLLFFTGVTRIASNICKEQIDTVKSKTLQLQRMMELVPEAVNILVSNTSDINDFGRLLHETWMLKRSLTNKISNSVVDSIYSSAIKAGAIGGKLLGAGGGGFMLFFAPPDKHPQICNALEGLVRVPFLMENTGCEIIYPALNSGVNSVKEHYPSNIM